MLVQMNHRKAEAMTQNTRECGLAGAGTAENRDALHVRLREGDGR